LESKKFELRCYCEYSVAICLFFLWSFCLDTKRTKKSQSIWGNC